MLFLTTSASAAALDFGRFIASSTCAVLSVMLSLGLVSFGLGLGLGLEPCGLVNITAFNLTAHQ